ncbi:MAG: type 1 glutamine amidotransferase [Planctomycetota bacterium]
MSGPCRYLLLQMRLADDLMSEHEIECFARAFEVEPTSFVTHDLVNSVPPNGLIDSVNAVVVGGSGDFSVVKGGDWFEPAMALFRHLYESGKPTFASCWGFQALAQALGGTVVTDFDRAEVGTVELAMTECGLQDPVFGPLGNKFLVQIGHQDIVEVLPDSAKLLCSSSSVKHQAYTFEGKPIYATQYHPEMEKEDLIKRLSAYPEYVYSATGLSMEEFKATCQDAFHNVGVLRRFRDQFVIE